MRTVIRHRPTAGEHLAAMRAQLDEFARWRAGNVTKASEYDANGRWKFAGVADELRAAREGEDLGRKYAGDPYRAARALGVPVDRMDAAQLTARYGRGRGVAGAYSPATRSILLADNLGPHVEREVLAHEIAHARGHGAADDKLADVFAKAFLKQAPDPLARAKAAQAWQERLMERARR